MIDLSEIKKLPDTEKVKIIDEILESMDGQANEENNIPDEAYELKLHQLLKERLTAYEKGEMKSFTWEEVEERLKIARQKLLNLHHE